MRKWVSSPAYRAAVEVVAEARREAGLTQRELEARLGQTHHGMISKIETRERQMNFVEFIAIARALGTDEVELFRRVLKALPDKLDV